MSKFGTFVYATLFGLTCQLAQAIDRFGQNILPEHVAHVDQGKRMQEAGETDKAIAQFKTVIEKQPDYFAAYYNLGLALVEKSSYSAAIEALEKAREIRERNQLRDATIYNSLGWAYMLSGNKDQAEKYFSQGIRNESNLSAESKARLYNNSGWLYMSTGQYKQARAALTTAATQYKSKTAIENLKTLDRIEGVNVPR
jgi:tetratricopeptide (TPR) repeat protein